MCNIQPEKGRTLGPKSVLHYRGFHCMENPLRLHTHTVIILMQALPLQIANDNIFVDPTTGHLWVGIIVDSLKVTDYIKDRTTPVASKCLHISIDPTSELPFNQSLVEEVFSTTGEFEKGLVGAVTGCVYVEGRLLISTIARDMMMCEAPYIMYN